MKKDNYNLIIAVDPGFDYTKVCVNGVLFKIPYNVIDITGNEKDYIASKKQGFILSTYIQNRSNLVGIDARRLLLDEKQNDKIKEKYLTATSYNRFATDDTAINIMTCIGYGLIQYSEYSKKNDLIPTLELDELGKEDSKWTIYIGLALPYEATDEWEYIKTKLPGNHRFSIETEIEKYELDFYIDSKNILKKEQVVAAFIGLIADDIGREYENPEALNLLPALVIDGGYKTIGIFELTRNNKIVGGESNTEFAMCKVNQRVAEIIQKKYGRDIEEYNIEDIIQDGGITSYFDKEECIIKEIDVNKLRQEEIERSAKGLMDYLNDKYDHLVVIKKIIFTGGTGASYFDYILKELQKVNIKLSENTFLTEYDFMGKKIEPVYGVVVGLYKFMAFMIKRREEMVQSKAE